MRRVHLYQVVEQLKERYSISRLCAYLGFPRSSYYLWLSNGKPEHKRFNPDLAQVITAVFNETQKGYRFISYQLRRKYDIFCHPKTVLRYMRILGLKSPIRKKRYHSCTQREINEKARHVHYNVLARNFKAERPLQKLTTDVSYVYHKQGRMFLSIIKDCYDNSILAYTLSDYNDNQLVFENLDLVFNENWDATHICVLHSDQGFQYTNQLYLRKLDQYGVTISHSGKGNCYDNASCENFFSHLKSESLRLFPPNNRDELSQQIKEYMDWYNYDRPQEILKGMTPMEFRAL
ncbi:IS3 family transposase [Streptococcus ruminantium]|uniref:IS3 family transposase n=1 Tax=Streptococcus ruminantium TaxID=1917441 RepID=UPI001F029E8D|nr:IS3 family transposase [Streptococcus ruminantium]BDD39285.1 transposase [Streptococcus ruminantium]